MERRAVRQQRGLTGKRKVAILLSLFPPDEAALVLKHLDEEEVELLLSEMARLGVMANETIQHLVEESTQRLKGNQPITAGSAAEVRSLLIQAFDAHQGAVLWARLEALLKEPSLERDVELLSKLSAIPPQHLVELVRDENPQAIALLSGLLLPSHGAAILNELSPELRSEVAVRLLITESPSEEVLDAIRRPLQDAIAPATQRTARFNGLQVLVQILSNLPREVIQEILANLEQRNPELAERVQQAMFTFEDLIKLGGRLLQRVLREADMRELALALKGASEELKEKIFRNMSQRAAQILREEMDYIDPVRLRDVIATQRRIVDIVWKLEEAGEITVPRGGEEVLV